MPYRRELPVNALQLDHQNPRLSVDQDSQRDTIRALAEYQGRKLQFLAEHIVENGLDPSELVIVTPNRSAPNRSDGDKFVVLDGNRRLTALRALENPDLVADVVPTGVAQAIRQLGSRYKAEPVEELLCLVCENRSEANQWIELRHSGERGGAGQVPWGPDESDRFRANFMGEKPNRASQVLDFLEKRGLINREQRRKAPTTLERALGSPDIRHQLGLSFSKKELRATATLDDVAKASAYLVTEISEGRLDVKDLYNKEQRKIFATNLPKNVAVSSWPNVGAPVSLQDTEIQKTSRKGTRRNREPALRPNLIPRDCDLKVTSPRVGAIEGELRRLTISTSPNAVAVLFRVFVELSVDEYRVKEGLPSLKKDILANKLRSVADHLVSQQRISEMEARPVRRAASKDSFLAPSVTLMNQWVHNQYVFPTESDLRSNWDNLEPFITAIWSV